MFNKRTILAVTLMAGAAARAQSSFEGKELVDRLILSPPEKTPYRGLDEVFYFPRAQAPLELAKIPAQQMLPYLNERFNATISSQERLGILYVMQAWRRALNNEFQARFPRLPGETESGYLERTRLAQKSLAKDLSENIPEGKGLVALYKKALTSSAREVRESPYVEVTPVFLIKSEFRQDFYMMFADLLLDPRNEVKAMGIAGLFKLADDILLPEIEACKKFPPEDYANCLKALVTHSSSEAYKMRSEALAMGNPKVIRAVMSSLAADNPTRVDQFLRKFKDQPQVAAQFHHALTYMVAPASWEVVEAAWRHGDLAARQEILASGLFGQPESKVHQLYAEALQIPELKPIVESKLAKKAMPPSVSCLSPTQSLFGVKPKD